MTFSNPTQIVKQVGKKMESNRTEGKKKEHFRTYSVTSFTSINCKCCATVRNKNSQS